MADNRPRPELLIRADGDGRTGLGHVIRSLALAQALEPAWQPVFATRCELPAIHHEIEAVARREVVPPSLAVADEPAWIAARFPASAVVVLDGYQFEASTEAALRAGGRRVVSIDDIPSRPFAADLVINQAGGLSPTDYQAAPYTRFALGPDYALLRPEFLAAARTPQPRAGTGDVLVCLGGADPNDEVRSVVARALQLFPSATVQVVLGAAYAFRPAFDSFAAQQGKRVQVHAGVSAPEMVDLMRRCGAAVLSPSGVAYEYGSVGGLLLLHPIADNQRNLHRFLQSEGLGASFAAPVPDGPTIARMAALQRTVFDGRSDQRLRQAVAELTV